METHDDIPAPSRMVDPDTLSRKQSPSCTSVSQDLDLSAMISDIQANMAELIQESSVLIDDHDRERMAQEVVNFFLEELLEDIKDGKYCISIKYPCSGWLMHLFRKGWPKRKNKRSKPLHTDMYTQVS